MDTVKELICARNKTVQLCVNAFNCTIKFRIIRNFDLTHGCHVNPHVNFRQKAPQDRGVFVPPVAATDSLSTNDIAVSNKEQVESNGKDFQDGITCTQISVEPKIQMIEPTLASTWHSMGQLDCVRL